MYGIAKPHILILFFNACVYLVEHAVYTFTYPAKREYSVHLEVKGGRGDYIAAMFLKYYNFKVLLEDRGIIIVETFCTLYDMT